MTTVPEILRRDADKYEEKALDYAPNPDDPFENFSFSGNFADRLMADTPIHMTAGRRQQLLSCCVLIGVKISRLQTVGLFGEAKNETIRDTIRDLRVYLGILESMLFSYEASHEPFIVTMESLDEASDKFSAIAGDVIREGDLVTWGDLTAAGTAQPGTVVGAAYPAQRTKLGAGSWGTSMTPAEVRDLVETR